jgi:hypothetical protein
VFGSARVSRRSQGEISGRESFGRRPTVVKGSRLEQPEVDKVDLQAAGQLAHSSMLPATPVLIGPQRLDSNPRHSRASGVLDSATETGDQSRHALVVDSGEVEVRSARHEDSAATCRVGSVVRGLMRWSRGTEWGRQVAIAVGDVDRLAPTHREKSRAKLGSAGFVIVDAPGAEPDERPRRFGSVPDAVVARPLRHVSRPRRGGCARLL